MSKQDLLAKLDKLLNLVKVIQIEYCSKINKIKYRILFLFLIAILITIAFPILLILYCNIIDLLLIIIGVIWYVVLLTPICIIFDKYLKAIRQLCLENARSVCSEIRNLLNELGTSINNIVSKKSCIDEVARTIKTAWDNHIYLPITRLINIVISNKENTKSLRILAVYSNFCRKCTTLEKKLAELSQEIEEYSC